MSLSIFGRPFDHTHENEVLHNFLEAADAHWHDKSESVVILANVSWNNSAVDLVFLKRNAIVIVDFKNYGGSIEMSENGPWYASEAEQRVVVRGGGAHKNPFMQVKAYKSSLMSWFNAFGAHLPSRNRPNAGRINGLVVFHRPCDLDARRDLGPSINSWFRVSSFANCIRQLDEFASPDISLSDADLAAIVAQLGVTKYELPGIPRLAATSYEQNDGVEFLPQTLREALHAINTFLDSEDRVLIVSGMIGTGLPLLLPAITSSIEDRGLRSTLGARSARVAAKYGDLVQSLFQVLYKRTPLERDNVLVYERLSNSDSLNHVYLLVDAHLISDGTQTSGLRKYGSGNLLRDYFEFVGLKENERKVIVMGDPFQLSYGGGNESAMNKAMLEGICELPVLEISLPYLLPTETSDELVEAAQTIAAAISTQTFNRLTLNEQSCCKLVSADCLEEVLRAVFSADPHNTKYIAYTNEDVSRINRFVRESVFGRGPLITPGDVIHIRTAGRRSSSANDHQLAHDSFATVTAVDDSVPPLVQDLKGRTHPIVVPFVRLTVSTGESPMQATFLCFRSFLYSEKPDELSRDELVALRVDAEIRWKRIASSSGLGMARDSEDRITFLQRDERLNAARVRYGYALTIFGAQSHRFPNVVANLDMTGHDSLKERAKESYFRYAYTMFTVPITSILLYGQRDLHPLALAKWDDRPVASKGTNWNARRALDAISLSPDNKLQAVLRLAIRDQLKKTDISLAAVEHKPYRERYYLSWRSDFVHVDGIFDGSGLFSSLVAQDATSSEALAAVRDALSLPHVVPKI